MHLRLRLGNGEASDRIPKSMGEEKLILTTVTVK